MRLEGVITNVANFGAFVDIGVHQDGLVHVSQIADHYVDDLHKEVKVGQVVQVTVLDVDLDRSRISLTMKKSQHVERKQSAQPRSLKKKSSRVEKDSKPSALASQLQAALEKRC